MSKLSDLLAQREALEQAIQAARQEEIKEAVATIRGLVEQFDLTPQDVFPSRGTKKANSGKSGPVAAKYRNPETGDTWTGRGKAPKWIDGKDRAQFAIWLLQIANKIGARVRPSLLAFGTVTFSSSPLWEERIRLNPTGYPNSSDYARYGYVNDSRNDNRKKKASFAEPLSFFAHMQKRLEGNVPDALRHAHYSHKNTQSGVFV